MPYYCILLLNIKQKIKIFLIFKKMPKEKSTDYDYFYNYSAEP